jgi:hypothetical protein
MKKILILLIPISAISLNASQPFGEEYWDIRQGDLYKKFPKKEEISSEVNPAQGTTAGSESAGAAHSGRWW